MLKIILGLILSHPLAVFAQQAISTPSLTDLAAPKSDSAVQMLAAVFGPVAGIFGDGAASVFGDQMMAFNLSITAVAVIWFGYNVVSGIVQGAHDGEFLGKRYSSLWMPIRNVTGMAAIVPVFGGFSLAQLVLASAAVIGVGIANLVAAHIPASAYPTPLAVGILPQPSIVFEKLEGGHKCIWEKQQRVFAEAKNLSSFINPVPDPEELTWLLSISPARSEKLTVTPTQIKYEFGVHDGAQGIPSDECGSVDWKLVDPTSLTMTSENAQNALAAANASAVKIVSGINNDIKTAYAKIAWIDPIEEDASYQARKKQLKEDLSVIVEKWENEVKQYYQQINDFEKNRLKDLVRQQIESHGWVGAGLASAQAVWDSVAVALSSPEEGTHKTGEYESDNRHEFGACGATDWLTSPGACMQKKMLNIAKGTDHLFTNMSGSPFVMSPILGAKILHFVGTSIVFGLGLLAVGVGLAAVAGVASTAGGTALWGFASSYVGVMFVMLAPVTLFGLQLLVMIPSVVVIAWVFAVMTWLVIVAEALIAAPLWAMAHLDNEGEGMGKRTAHGYLFILNLLCRPAILVIVLGLVYSIAEVIGNLMNTTLAGYVASVLAASSGIWVMKLAIIAACLWLLLQANLKIAEVAASLLSIIPTQVFAWVGGQFGSDVGAGVGGHVGSDFKGAGMAASAAAGAAGAAIGRGGDKLARDADRRADKQERQAGEEEREERRQAERQEARHERAERDAKSEARMAKMDAERAERQQQQDYERAEAKAERKGRELAKQRETTPGTKEYAQAVARYAEQQKQRDLAAQSLGASGYTSPMPGQRASTSNLSGGSGSGSGSALTTAPAASAAAQPSGSTGGTQRAALLSTPPVQAGAEDAGNVRGGVGEETT